MIIRIPENSNHPDDFFIYCKCTNNDLVGWTKDSSYTENEISEIPNDAIQFFIPDNDENTYMSYSEIREKLDKLKPLLIEEIRDLINKERDRLCYTPIQYNGYTFKADEISQQDITNATMLAFFEGKNFKKIWLTLEGAVELNYDDIIGVKMALGMRRQSLVYEANLMKIKLHELEYEELVQFKIEFKSYPILDEYK